MGRREIHCQANRRPPTTSLRPSFERRMVTNDDLGGAGSRHCSNVCSDLGDVVIASNTCVINTSQSKH